MKSLEKQYIALQNKMIRMEKMGQKTIAKNYKKILDDLRISMAKLYEHYEIDGQLTMAEMAKYNRLQKLDKEVSHMITNLYKSNSTVIKGTLEGVATTTYSNSIAIVKEHRKLKGIIKNLNVEKIVNDDMAGLKWIERLGKHRSDAIWDIQKEIKQGLKDGDTYSTMAKRLKITLESDIKKVNAVVRTESHRVMSDAKDKSFKEIQKAGVVFKKRWISSKDERVRGNKSSDKMNHVVMDGVTISSNEDFVLPDGAKGSGPGLTNSYNDINCRCIAVMVLEE